MAWVEGGDEPRTVRRAVQAERLMSMRTRDSAAYKGLYAQQMKRGARDFRTGTTIDVHTYVDDAIDIHHIFPQVWAAQNGVAEADAHSIVNKTTIDARTKRKIGGAAPGRSALITALQRPVDSAVVLVSGDLRVESFGGRTDVTTQQTTRLRTAPPQEIRTLQKSDVVAR